MKNLWAWIRGWVHRLLDHVRGSLPMAEPVLPLGQWQIRQWQVHAVPFTPGSSPSLVWKSSKVQYGFVCWRTADTWLRLQPSAN